MAKKIIKQKSKKSNKKINKKINKKSETNIEYASMCAIALVIEDRKVFDVIHQKVSIPQKTVYYRSLKGGEKAGLIWL